MSHDSDVAQMYRELHEDQKARRTARKEHNLAVLRASTLTFTTKNNGDVVLIRDRAFPAIDFFTSTGRCLIGSRWCLMDAEALLRKLGLIV